jgi:hypothetical protein
VRVLTPPYVKHYWTLCEDISGGWSDHKSDRGDPTNHGWNFDTILKLRIRINSSIQN